MSTARIVALLVLALACRPLPARAQTGVPNPRVFSNLFGGAASGAASPQALDFSGALYAAYDDDVLAQGSRPAPGQSTLAGTYTGAQAALLYGKRYATSQFSLSASGAGRYLTDTQEVLTTFLGGGAQYTRSMTSRSVLSLAQTAYYRPYFNFVPIETGSSVGPSLDDGGGDLGAEVDVGDPGAPEDISLSTNRDGVIYRGVADFNYALTPTSSLTFGAAYSAADFSNSEVENPSSLRWGAFGRYRKRLTQFVSLRLGYGYRKLRADGSGRDASHNIDVGIDYAQPFTIGRGRTRLSVSTGSALLVRDDLTSEGGSANRVKFLVLGRAILRHDFARAWQAQLSYVRSLQFVDGINDPFLSDRVLASVGGLIGRRTDVFASAGYVSGAFGANDRNYDTAVGNVRVRTALTRNTAVFVQYYYYQYLFDEAYAASLQLPPQQERQGVRAGLTLWLPLLR